METISSESNENRSKIKIVQAEGQLNNLEKAMHCEGNIKNMNSEEGNGNKVCNTIESSANIVNIIPEGIISKFKENHESKYGKFEERFAIPNSKQNDTGRILLQNDFRPLKKLTASNLSPENQANSTTNENMLKSNEKSYSFNSDSNEPTPSRSIQLSISGLDSAEKKIEEPAKILENKVKMIREQGITISWKITENPPDFPVNGIVPTENPKTVEHDGNSLSNNLLLEMGNEGQISGEEEPTKKLVIVETIPTENNSVTAQQVIDLTLTNEGEQVKAKRKRKRYSAILFYF